MPNQNTHMHRHKSIYKFLFLFVFTFNLICVAAETSLSRIDLVEALTPLMSKNQLPVEDYTARYTDIGHLSSQQQLALNGYLMQATTRGGTTGSRFSPDMPATRAQAAVMIHRMLVAQNPQWDAGVTRSVTLIDAKAVPWAKKAFNALANAAIIQPIGPGYVFPKRGVDADTATQWVQAAQAWAKTPRALAGMNAAEAVELVGPPRVASPDRAVTEPVTPTASIVPDTIELDTIEPELPTESLEVVPTKSLEAVPTPSISTEARNATRNYQWQIRAYGGLSLGQSPYQSNQPPAEVVEERYQMADGAAEDLRTTGSGSPKNKRLYGLESGIEFSRKVVDKPFWLVTGYGYGIVKETMPATTITMPVVFYELMLNPNIHNYVDGATEDGRLEIFNLGEHVVRKTTHTLRLGLQHAFYKKTMQKAHIECYWGGGLAISTAAIWGSVLELPQQNINKDPILWGALSPREDYITREKVRSFYHTQTQASAYGELGGLASRNSMHVGVQARFQLNPGELSVDEKGNKRLTREISSLGTIFVGRRF